MKAMNAFSSYVRQRRKFRCRIQAMRSKILSEAISKLERTIDRLAADFPATEEREHLQEAVVVVLDHAENMDAAFELCHWIEVYFDEEKLKEYRGKKDHIRERIREAFEVLRTEK